MSGTGWADERGVSEVLGAMLLFGIVIVALGGYQAFVVPQQNAEIELKHDAQVNDEFAEIQPSISNAAATGTTRTTSITMGTRYPVRVAGLNPPTVSGQLATRNSGEINATGLGDPDLESICGLPPETRAITYDADYNELDDPGTLVYENGVTYQTTDKGILVQNQQELVDGTTIRLFPLTGEGFSTGSSGSKQVRFVPGETGTQTVTTSGTWELTFPSRIGKSSWEDEILDGSDQVADVTDSDGEVTVTFKQGTYTVQCTPVGIGSKPDQDPVPTSPEDSDNLNVNSRIGDIYLKSSSSFDSNSPTVTFANTGDEPWEFTQARLPFATGSNQNKATIKDDNGNTINTLYIADDFSSFGVTIPAEGEVTLTFEFDGNFYPGSAQPGSGWFMFTVEQSQGNHHEFRNYFVPDGLDTGAGNNNEGGDSGDCPGNSC